MSGYKKNPSGSLTGINPRMTAHQASTTPPDHTLATNYF